MPSLCQVININDSPPKLAQDTYEAVLLLPTYVGVEVLRVEAFDPDASSALAPTADKSRTAQLLFSLVERSVENFSVDRSSGTVTVINPNLNTERYQFTVKVRSTGLLFVCSRTVWIFGILIRNISTVISMEGLQVSDQFSLV